MIATEIRFCMILPLKRKYKNEAMIETPRAELANLFDKLAAAVRDPTITGVCLRGQPDGVTLEALREGGTA